ncbi:nuclear transport factor 2 family protein [Nocardia thraciensis]
MDSIRRAYRALQRAWSGQDWEAWAGTCAEGYRFDTGTGLRLDVAGTLAWSRAWFAAFPDYAEEIGALHIGADSAVAELVGEATSTADFVLGGATLLPATGSWACGCRPIPAAEGAFRVTAPVVGSVFGGHRLAYIAMCAYDRGRPERARGEHDGRRRRTRPCAVGERAFARARLARQ